MSEKINLPVIEKEEAEELTVMLWKGEDYLGECSATLRERFKDYWDGESKLPQGYEELDKLAWEFVERWEQFEVVLGKLAGYLYDLKEGEGVV